MPARTESSALLRIIITVLLALGVISVAPAAFAADNTLTISMSSPGQSYHGVPVFESNTTYTLDLGYGVMDDGYVAVLQVPTSDVTIPDSALVVPGGNTAIESITRLPDGNIQFTFATPFPADVEQGTFSLTFTVNEQVQSVEKDLVWQFGLEPLVTHVILKKPGDTFASVSDSFSKSAGNDNLGRFVSVNLTNDVLTLDPAVMDDKLAYTLQYSTAAAKTVTFTDTLDAPYTMTGTATAVLTSWDSDGLNKTTAPIAFPITAGAAGFTTTIDLPVNSMLTVDYTAELADQSAVDQAEADLQALWLEHTDTDGAIWKAYGNTVSDGAHSHSANYGFWWRADQPDPGSALVKWGRPYTQIVHVAAGTAIDAPASVTWNFRADLTGWDGSNKYRTLNQDVILEDPLLGDHVWDTAAADFLTIAQDGTPVTPVVATSQADVADGPAFSVWVDPATQTLWVNLGQQPDVITLQAKSQVLSVAGLSSSGNGTATDYSVPNRAIYHYNTKTQDAWSSVTLRDKKDGTIEVPGVFAKSGPGSEIQATPGARVTVPYTFTVNGDGQDSVNATLSTITDVVDHGAFDVTAGSLAAVTSSVTGSFGGMSLQPGDIDVVLNADGNLEFTLSAAGLARASSASVSPTARLVLSFHLMTFPVVGKQTLALNNNAFLHGSDVDVTYVSSFSASASSFGDELEVSKTVYDGSGFVTSLRDPLDGDGNPTQRDFIYRIGLLPHGNFTNMVRDVTDHLPAQVSFVGFVAAGDVASGTTQAGASYHVPSTNLTVSYDAATGNVVAGRTTLAARHPVYFYVKVHLDSFSPNVPIVNAIRNNKASIVPTGGYPLDLAKVDVTDVNRSITDRTAVFQVFDSSGDLVVDDVYVVGGRLMVSDGKGGDQAVLVETPGTYTVQEVTAPRGYEVNADVFTAVVSPDGSTDQVVIGDTPSATPYLTYALGDIVWVDTNGDGGQDLGEPFLPDVTVDLLDVDGNVLATTTTDAHGLYLFDNLDAGDYRVRFTLTPEQAVLYFFTGHDQQGDAGDSDAVVTGTPDIGTTETIHLGDADAALTVDYDAQPFDASQGVDPTWDAGVLAKADAKTYAIGDYTWVDTDRNGEQDLGEPVLTGVGVTLLAADGTTELDATTTDANGLYLFDVLPAGSYYVRFELTPAQAQAYLFTELGQATDATDSNAEASVADRSVGTTSEIVLGDANAALTTGYADQVFAATQGVDPTWDAGVVTKTYAIGDYTWVDTDRNGVQDLGEPVLPGVTVDLLDADGTVLDTTTTDADGRYLFDDLAAGEYRLVFTLTDQQAADYVFTGIDDGTDLSDSDATPMADPAEGRTVLITLDDTDSALTTGYAAQPVSATEGIDPTWDAGVVTKSYAIGDYTWVDRDSDGQQDRHEEVLPGVSVALLDVDGAVLDTTRTDADGRYLFDELAAGDYQVRFTLTAGQAKKYVFTRSEHGADGADSDGIVSGDPTVATTVSVTLDDDNAALTTSYGAQPVQATQGIDPTWDAGVVDKAYAIGDYTWIDADSDGQQDAAEHVLPGVHVALLDQSGHQVATTTTDRQGRYLFDRLPAGTYRVRFELTDAQAEAFHFTRSEKGADASDSDAVVGSDETVGTTIRVRLDGSNTALTTDYVDQTVLASEGIDPTWDAGVALGGVSPNHGNQNDNGNGDGNLPNTGAPFSWWLAFAAGLALLVGLVLVAVGRRRAVRTVSTRD